MDHSSDLYMPTFENVQAKEDDVNALKSETQRINKMRETIQRKLRQVEDQKSDTEGQRDTLRGQITGLEKGNGLVKVAWKHSRKVTAL